MNGENNKHFYLFVGSFLLLILIGCMTPIEKNQKSKDKILKIDEKISSNEGELMEFSKGYVYGANYALSLDPSPSKYSSLAYDLTDRSLIITGNPSAETAGLMKKSSEKLLSDEESERFSGQILLDAQNKRVERLQFQIKDLEDQRLIELKKWETIADQNAKDANFVFQIRKWLGRLKWIIISIVGLRIFAALAPPPYNSIGLIFDWIIGGAFRLISKLFTGATKAAGVVTEEVYKASDDALKGVVKAVQKVREKDPVVKQKIDIELLAETAEPERMKIIEVKKELKMI